jgi:hypothetical protein
MNKTEEAIKIQIKDAEDGMKECEEKDSLIYQGWKEALQWVLSKDTENLEIDITTQDCQELMEGRVFTWQYKTKEGTVIDLRIFNPDEFDTIPTDKDIEAYAKTYIQLHEWYPYKNLNGYYAIAKNIERKPFKETSLIALDEEEWGEGITEEAEVFSATVTLGQEDESHSTKNTYEVAYPVSIIENAFKQAKQEGE